MTSLDARRLRHTDWTVKAARDGGALGGLAWGLRRGSDLPAALATPDASGRALHDALASIVTPARVHARLLAPAAPRVDAWLAQGLATRGQTGLVQWRSVGPWLFGQLELDTHGGELGALTQRAYADVFAALRAADCPHLLRVWNYVPAINRDDDGLERYRRFNQGRQQAFLDAGARAFEGAPAACAVGTHDAPLMVCFLAGRRAPRALENPRQTPAWRYPSDFGPRPPSFSRAALVEAGEACLALFVSGTASIVGHQSLHAGDVRAQTRETLANLQAVLAEARAQGSAGFDLAALDLTVYLRHADDAAAVQSELAAALGTHSRALTEAVLVEADICRAELLVEIEAHGVAAGSLRA